MKSFKWYHMVIAAILLFGGILSIHEGQNHTHKLFEWGGAIALVLFGVFLFFIWNRQTDK